MDFHQFLTDADDVDTWMLDILRLVSSDDIGKDESNVQTLLKKHKDTTDELKNYASTIDALHEQVKIIRNRKIIFVFVYKRIYFDDIDAFK